MTKKKVYRKYRTRRKGGQTYWIGRKGIAKSINRIHPNINIKDSSRIVDMTFDGVKSNLRRERRYAQPDFGVFKIKHRKERWGRNPLTGERIKIKAKNIIKFTPSKTLKSELLK